MYTIAYVIRKFGLVFVAIVAMIVLGMRYIPTLQTAQQQTAQQQTAQQQTAQQQTAQTAQQQTAQQQTAQQQTAQQQEVLPAQGGSRQHVVKEGDTLTAIASQYSVTVEGIVTLNGINDPNALSVGQVLNIPESTFSGDGYTLTGSPFPVIESILGPVGYAKTADEQNLPWPADWTTVARPKFEHINGDPVWRTQAILPGETALYVGSGIWTPKGLYTGCSAGWFVNDTNVTIDIQVLSMSEIVVGNSNNYDAMARELAKRTSSGNQCATGYLGQIPLH